MEIRLTLDVTDLQRYQLAVWLDGEPTKRLATREEIRAQIDSVITALWDDVEANVGIHRLPDATERGLLPTAKPRTD